MADNYQLQISSPHNAEFFGQLVDSLEIGYRIVWNGRSEEFTVTGIEDEEGSWGGVGRFKKTVIVENGNRSNGAQFRLRFEEGTDGDLTPFSVSIEARCVVQRQIGENGNSNGWGRCTDVESLAWTNPVKSSEPDEERIATDGGEDQEQPESLDQDDVPMITVSNGNGTTVLGPDPVAFQRWESDQDD